MGGTATRRSQLGLVVWIAALTVGLVAFHRLSGGWLEPPPVRPGGWGVWAEGRDPLVATVAVLRLLVLALGWYLLVVTSLGIVVRLVRAPRVARIADRVTLPALRGLLRDALGVTLASAVIATGPAALATTARADAAPPEVADLLPGWSRDRDGLDRPGRLDDHPADRPDGLDDHPAGRPDGLDDHPGLEDHPEGLDGHAPPDHAATPGTSLPLPLDLVARHRASGDEGTDGEPGDPAGMDRPDDPARGDVSTTPTGDDGAPAPSSAAGADAVPAGDLSVSGEQAVVVQPGDSLWSIARDALISRSQPPRSQPPDDTEVAAYWTVVVEHNRRQLPDPGNPDLIFPGDTVLLPPISQTASR